MSRDTTVTTVEPIHTHKYDPLVTYSCSSYKNDADEVVPLCIGSPRYDPAKYKAQILQRLSSRELTLEQKAQSMMVMIGQAYEVGVGEGKRNEDWYQDSLDSMHKQAREQYESR